MAGCTILAVALDLYTVHFYLIPYYAGRIRHRPSGALQSLPLSQLAAGHPVWLWLAYVAATLTLAVVCITNRNTAASQAAKT